MRGRTGVRSMVGAMVTALALVAAGCTPTTGAGGSAHGVCAGWSNPNGTTTATAAESGGGPAPEKLADRCLHLNQVQVIGSHNSYHIRPEEPLWSALRAFDSALADSLEYTHGPLPQQFDREGVRQIELDVFADPDGGLYDQRHIMPILGLPADSGIPELEQPGFKVFHVQEIDFLSSCGWTFVECLQQVKSWSDAHPTHLPLAILVELKDDDIPDPLNAGFVHPHKIGPPELDALDAEIRSVFSERRLITPDDIRGHYPTLEDAVLQRGWPKLGDARGKVMFLMDNGGHYRTDYLAGHPSLRGRVLFTNARPGDDDAAFVEHNDALGATNIAEIQTLVRDGYVVRTRADADTVEARTNDTATRDAAIASGAQWVSTDYPVPGLALFPSSYVASIPDGHPARCNPVNTGPRCRNDALERL
jgi:calcium-dependent phosphoinositide phospholipase C